MSSPSELYGPTFNSLYDFYFIFVTYEHDWYVINKKEVVVNPFTFKCKMSNDHDYYAATGITLRNAAGTIGLISNYQTQRIPQNGYGYLEIQRRD